WPVGAEPGRTARDFAPAWTDADRSDGRGADRAGCGATADHALGLLARVAGGARPGAVWSGRGDTPPRHRDAGQPQPVCAGGGARVSGAGDSRARSTVRPAVDTWLDVTFGAVRRNIRAWLLGWLARI